MAKPTKIIRIYVEDERPLIELRRLLTKQRGEQATFADVIKHLIKMDSDPQYNYFGGEKL